MAAKVPFVTLAAGPISGHIGDTSGNAVAGADVQACLPKGGQCYDTSSTPSGNFKEAVPYGRYTLTAFPPAETSLAQSTSSRSWAVSGPAGVAGANVTMPVLQPLPAGVSIGGQDGGVPVLYSGGPAPMTVRGCPHGVGAVEVRGTNDLTGKRAVILVPLLESPPGSGRYSATIPPIWPVHGNITITYDIYCVEAVAPTADLASGGNVVTIHGSGFTGATAVKFGATPATSFTVISSSLIEAVAPPGSGTVSVSVTTPHGSTGGGPLSAYTYISFRSVTPSDGPAHGSTAVVIKGDNLEDVNTVWFGDQIATDVKLVSDDEIEAVTPPGTGDAPITVGQIAYSVQGARAQSGPIPTVFFHYGGVPGQQASGAGETVVAKAPLAVTTVAAVRGADSDPDIPSFDPFPFEPGGGGNAQSPGGTGGSSWVLTNSSPKSLGLIYMAVILAVYALAAAEVSPVLLTASLLLIVLAVVMKGSSNHGLNAESDPSGTVSATDGTPIPGATAVLEQAPTAEGPFRPAMAASPGIDPHVNPQKTGRNGEFHWDVISDFYKVEASAPGCHAPGDPAEKTVATAVLPVPPPRFGLDLVLQCSRQVPPARPTITSLSKDVVSSKGGTQVEVVGTGFTPSAVVRFGLTRSPSVMYVSPNLLQATVPPGRGSDHVFVTTAGGPSVANLADDLTYRPAPVVTAVRAASGPPAGGTRVTIRGSGLAGAELVTFGQTTVTNFTVIGSVLVATTPPGRPGTVDVTVTTPVGKSAVTPADHFTYANPPRPR